MNKVLTYELVKEYYEKGYYTKVHLKELCTVGIISQSQYTILTSETYWESTN